MGVVGESRRQNPFGLTVGTHWIDGSPHTMNHAGAELYEHEPYGGASGIIDSGHDDAQRICHDEAPCDSYRTQNGNRGGYRQKATGCAADCETKHDHHRDHSRPILVTGSPAMCVGTFCL
jgi:hypothetical protein